MSTVTKPQRRSQEERSAATRERLLEATIECLIDLGYAGTTTTEIVRRAGVSRGAQVHHFPTKAELVHNAVLHLAERQRDLFLRSFPGLDDSKDRVSVAVDLLWSAYAGPLFVAALELIVAARTDPGLQAALTELRDRVTDGMQTLCREIFDAETLKRIQTRAAIDLTVNVMFGLALGRLLNGKQSREAKLLDAWKRLVRPMFEKEEASG